MPKTCRRCGTALPTQQGAGRPRLDCEDCAPARHRHTPAVVQAGEAPSVAAIVRVTIEHAKAAETLPGVLALHLACLLDAGGVTAQGAAALSREILRCGQQAVEQNRGQGDPLDQLQARRRRKAELAILSEESRL